MILQGPKVVTGTQNEQLSRAGPNGRSRCGLEAEPPILPHPQVLLHLDSNTWAQGCLSQAAELQSDMREALHAKKKVVLVHEMDASRGGVEEFGYFFGVTPQELKDLGLYAEPAIAMKAAPYRNVSLGLLARAVSAGGRSQLRAATAGTTAKSGLRTPAGVVAGFRTRLQLAKHVIKTRPAQRARTSATSGGSRGDSESEIRPSMSSQCSGQV